MATLPPELRRTTVPPAVRAWVTRLTGFSIAAVKRLPGASSTAVHRLISPDGQSVVLRRYVWPGFLNDEPVAPARELDALRYAASHGLAVPHVLAADTAGSEVGDGVPAIVMSFVPGRALPSPDPARLADSAAAIHAADAAGFAHEYFRWFDALPARPPSAAQRPRLWERALEVSSRVPSYRPAFIHRDFHPGNVALAPQSPRRRRRLGERLPRPSRLRRRDLQRQPDRLGRRGRR
jgi:aminoglycoside phosphotransferase (APT) family kinase protein